MLEFATIGALGAVDPQQQFIDLCGKRYTEMDASEQTACQLKIAAEFKAGADRMRAKDQSKPKLKRKVVPNPTAAERFSQPTEPTPDGADPPRTWRERVEAEASKQSSMTPYLLVGGFAVVGLAAAWWILRGSGR